MGGGGRCVSLHPLQCAGSETEVFFTQGYSHWTLLWNTPAWVTRRLWQLTKVLGTHSASHTHRVNTHHKHSFSSRQLNVSARLCSVFSFADIILWFSFDFIEMPGFSIWIHSSHFAFYLSLSLTLALTLPLSPLFICLAAVWFGKKQYFPQVGLVKHQLENTPR